ncbi:glycohydrolase toxin TNT-related protein [Paenibacillus harenae]|uniref:glycohydrolase toxin TNT-related protein n=1 Tax=Paenibacillus harenae TaxID=306543 RepID=UPI00278E3E6A|nr:glycohydrolase toxin TNT-related protein [Paenibacillus harenae]MDQ0062456.1 RHS repeat-associated protein [Paenibacillus harenae]
MFETGKIEHLLAHIDNIVNGEVNLPPGEQTKLFERIREVGKGYTIIGTNYTYKARNQLVHRENAIRYEEYDYTYDDAGNLLMDSRSKYEWNALGQLTKVTFPDGFGEKYAYDMLGRRISKTQFNHTGSTQEVTQYTYKGDTWAITEERDGSGNVTKSYTFDANDRPLTITMEGQTFWYVYNGHGDVAALTDKDGKVAARYEYDAWGLVSRMYNGLGERVREGTGWIGDLGTGNGSPGSVQGPEDESGNTEPDYHLGIGNAAEGTEGTEAVEAVSVAEDELSALLAEVDIEPTANITTELVKENPYRYKGYYWDRKTQYYYLQARYYDPRPARFISEDTYEGEIENPQSLNQYMYVENSPISNEDPTGKWCRAIVNSKLYSHPGYCNSSGPNVDYIEDSNGSNFGRSIINAGKVTGQWYPNNAFYLPWDKSGISDAFIGCAYDINCSGFVGFGITGVSVQLAKVPSLVKTTVSVVKKVWTWAKNLTKGTGENKWIDDAGNIIWPKNEGFAGTPKDITLQPGTKIDRYGYESGTFVSPQGTPYNMRSLAPGTENKPYNVYEVVKPLDAKGGKIAPWFDQPGGGTQYKLNQSIEQLIKGGYIRRVEP